MVITVLVNHFNGPVKWDCYGKLKEIQNDVKVVGTPDSYSLLWLQFTKLTFSVSLVFSKYTNIMVTVIWPNERSKEF